MKIVRLIICLLFGLLFVHSGLDKLLHYMPPPELTAAQQEMIAALSKIVWLMPLVAVVEVVGGLLIMMPRSRALGALVLLPVMTGIFIHHATMEPTGMVFVSILLLINLWIIIDNRKKYKAILR